MSAPIFLGLALNAAVGRMFDDEAVEALKAADLFVPGMSPATVAATILSTCHPRVVAAAIPDPYRLSDLMIQAICGHR
jgi:hypothetical protein